jgi:membrane protein YdbS with pleckstrin-like domain
MISLIALFVLVVISLIVIYKDYVYWKPHDYDSDDTSIKRFDK